MALSNPLIHLPVIAPVFRAKQLRTERPPDHGTWTARRLRRTWSCGEANYGCFWISMAAWGFMMIYDDFWLLHISGNAIIYNIYLLCFYIFLFTLINILHILGTQRKQYDWNMLKLLTRVSDWASQASWSFLQLACWFSQCCVCEPFHQQKRWLIGVEYLQFTVPY